MSTWSEDFAYSLEVLHAPHPGDLGPEDVEELIAALVEGIAISGKGATVAQALSKATGAEVAAAAAALGASWYVGVLIGAVLYASGKQFGDALLAPIDMERMIKLAKQFDAPVLDLPESEDVSWYPETTTAHETVPPPPPYPGYVLERGSSDSDSVELIQRALVSRGYHVDIDGDYGNETETAVKRFQQHQGLQVDGDVGPDTWKALFGR